MLWKEYDTLMKLCSLKPIYYYFLIFNPVAYLMFNNTDNKIDCFENSYSIIEISTQLAMAFDFTIHLASSARWSLNIIIPSYLPLLFSSLIGSTTISSDFI